MRGQQTLRKAARTLMVLVGMASLSACFAQEPSTAMDWRSDCVGRMQLSLPGKVDVAANSFAVLEAEYKVKSLQPQFEFPDGQIAGYSAHDYLGSVLVSEPLTPDQQASLLRAAQAGVKRAETYAKRIKRDAGGDSTVFEELSVAPLTGWASRVNTAYTMTVAVGNHIVRSGSVTAPEHMAWSRQSFDIKVNGLALRSFGDLPQSAGVCFPFIFIKDDGSPRRAISVTYRLQEHPDVTVWLEDSSAEAVDLGQDPAKFTAEYQTSFFWQQRYQSRADWRSLWPGTKGVRLDGRKGLASFVELKRKDGAVDFGYLAVVRGDPKAKSDEPDLMLFVVRDAKNAIARGMQPIERDQLLEIAQTIAASVKHRSVR
jgi:hypothetical protein